MTYPDHDRRIHERLYLEDMGDKFQKAFFQFRRVIAEPRKRKNDRPAFVDFGLILIGGILFAVCMAFVRWAV